MHAFHCLLGLAFGIAGTGAAVLGKLADAYGIAFVYHLCSFLPLLGRFTAFLPNPRKKGQPARSV